MAVTWCSRATMISSPRPCGSRLKKSWTLIAGRRGTRASRVSGYERSVARLSGVWVSLRGEAATLASSSPRRRPPGGQRNRYSRRLCPRTEALVATERHRAHQGACPRSPGGFRFSIVPRARSTFSAKSPVSAEPEMLHRKWQGSPKGAERSRKRGDHRPPCSSPQPEV
jgi:hypothetical protein